MHRKLMLALLGLAFAIPTSAIAQDCGCETTAPACVKTRKKLALVTVKKEVNRLAFACVTDECGCTKKKLVKVKKCVERKRPMLIDVPVDPCKKNCFENLADRMRAMKAKCRSRKNDCCESCEAVSVPMTPMEPASIDAMPTTPVEPHPADSHGEPVPVLEAPTPAGSEQ